MRTETAALLVWLALTATLASMAQPDADAGSGETAGAEGALPLAEPETRSEGLTVAFPSDMIILAENDPNIEPDGDSGEDSGMIITPLPEDLFQRCATKALAGAYGTLEPWQIVGYTQALRYTPVKRLAWVTSYFPAEGFARGQQCRWWGAGCSERVAAANELPGFAFVWMPETGLRQILDTGADSNDRRARNPRRASRRPADHWADFWEEREGSLFGDENGGTREVWAVRGRQPVQWKHGRSRKHPRGRAPSHAWMDY